MTKLKKMLGSVRFWFCVVFVLAAYLGQEQFIMQSIAKALETFTALGIAIRTFDKLIDNLGTDI